MHAESSCDGRVTFGERPKLLILLPFCSCRCFWGADATHGGYKLLNYCCAATLLGCMLIDPGSQQTPRGCSWRAATEGDLGGVQSAGIGDFPAGLRLATQVVSAFHQSGFAGGVCHLSFYRLRKGRDRRGV